MTAPQTYPTLGTTTAAELTPVTPDASPVLFADSTRPQLIPSSFSHVASYANGFYAWPAAELARFPRHIQISVFSGQPQQAEVARCLDVERFDATPADVVPFLDARNRLRKDATIYCSLSSVPAVLSAINDAYLSLSPWRLWIAWWWGKAMPPTREQVLAQLAAEFGVSSAAWSPRSPLVATLPPQRLWACQWRNGADYDTSVLYGTDDFTVR